MDSFIILILIGFAVGTVGTLIGAGGGFILVPLMLLIFPGYAPEVITAVSMAVVASNATSGTIAYMRAKRVDYKAGIIFAICTIPGSILGVLTTQFIPRDLFNIIFGVILVALAVFLFFRKKKKDVNPHHDMHGKQWVHQTITDKWDTSYSYSYNIVLGMVISVFVGYFSPLLGIGGGIIHVPAMVEWLYFPVHIATATSHFILAIMATVSVIVHIFQGSYDDPFVLRMVIFLIIGVVPGAQLGAYLSRRLKGRIIVRALAISLGIVGVRILFSGYF